jgi:hypothetical protein
MISKKIYIKKKNILDIRGISYGIIVMKTCIFIITLLAFTSIALALSLQDKKVAVDGCTKTAIGDWKSEKLNFHNEKTINIQDNKIVIIGSHNSDEHFLRNKRSFKVGGKFIEFTENILGGEKEISFKTQPHLITAKIDYGNNIHDYRNC